MFVFDTIDMISNIDPFVLGKVVKALANQFPNMLEDVEVNEASIQTIKNLFSVQGGLCIVEQPFCSMPCSYSVFLFFDTFVILQAS